jgi:hypothetical protein
MFAQTSAASFGLAQERFHELLEIAPWYFQEARRCDSARACLAAEIMIGSALEAALMCMVSAYPEDIEEWAKTHQQRPLDRWSLHQLIHAARHAGWLQGFPKCDDLDEMLEYAAQNRKPDPDVLRQFRNWVHPNVYVENEPLNRKRFALLEGVYLFVFERLDEECKANRTPATRTV